MWGKGKIHIFDNTLPTTSIQTSVALSKHPIIVLLFLHSPSHTFLARFLQKWNISDIICKNLASISHFRQTCQILSNQTFADSDVPCKITLSSQLPFTLALSCLHDLPKLNATSWHRIQLITNYL